MHNAFYGSQELKDLTLAQVRRHREADEIIQRVYFVGGKGCHLGCLTHSNSGSRSKLDRLLAIPPRVGYWLEAVFEGLPKEDCAQWVEDSTQAIAAGADLSRCHYALAVWLLGDESPSAVGNKHELVADAVAGVRLLSQRAASGECVTEQEWSAAESAARSAAWSADMSARSAESAAWSARSAESAAESAARSAARSARSAESAARSAESAAESAARSAAWRSIAAKSLEIFRDAPVIEGVQDSPKLQFSLMAMRANAI